MNNTETSIEYGGILFFMQNLSDYLPYTVLNIIGAVFGSIGNLLIIGAILVTKKLHTATNSLVLNLALADFFVSSFMDSFTVVGVLVGRRFFITKQNFCNFLASFCVISCVTSLISITFIAFNRYIFIVHKHLYERLFTRNMTTAYCLSTWIIAIMIDLPNYIGWGNHYFDLATLDCVWNRLASRLYVYFITLIVIFFPIFLVCIFYIKIYKKVTKMSSKNLRESYTLIKITKGLFASCLMFIICALPYGLVLLIDVNNKLPRTAYMFPGLMLHLNSSLNPILYALTNSQIREGYYNLLFFLFNRKKYTY